MDEDVGELSEFSDFEDASLLELTSEQALLSSRLQEFDEDEEDESSLLEVQGGRRRSGRRRRRSERRRRRSERRRRRNQRRRRRTLSWVKKAAKSTVNTVTAVATPILNQAAQQAQSIAADLESIATDSASNVFDKLQQWAYAASGTFCAFLLNEVEGIGYGPVDIRCPMIYPNCAVVHLMWAKCKVKGSALASTSNVAGQLTCAGSDGDGTLAGILSPLPTTSAEVATVMPNLVAFYNQFLGEGWRNTKKNKRSGVSFRVLTRALG
jgi:hypothetical protein